MHTARTHTHSERERAIEIENVRMKKRIQFNFCWDKNEHTIDLVFPSNKIKTANIKPFELCMVKRPFCCDGIDGLNRIHK